MSSAEPGRREVEVAAEYLTALGRSKFLLNKSQATAEWIAEQKSRTINPYFKNHTLEELPGLADVARTSATALRNIAFMGVAAFGADLVVTFGVSLTAANTVFMIAAAGAAIGGAAGSATCRKWSNEVATEFMDRSDRLADVELSDDQLKAIEQERVEAAIELADATEQYVTTFGDPNNADFESAARQIINEYNRRTLSERSTSRGPLGFDLGL